MRHKKQSESCTFPHDFQVIVTKPTSQHLTTIQHTTSKQIIKKSQTQQYNIQHRNKRTDNPTKTSTETPKTNKQPKQSSTASYHTTTLPHHAHPANAGEDDPTTRQDDPAAPPQNLNQPPRCQITTASPPPDHTTPFDNVATMDPINSRASFYPSN